MIYTAMATGFFVTAIINLHLLLSRSSKFAESIEHGSGQTLGELVTGFSWFNLVTVVVCVLAGLVCILLGWWEANG